MKSCCNDDFTKWLSWMQSRMLDIAEKVRKNHIRHYEGFFDEFQFPIVERFIKSEKVKCSDWGGYCDADRRLVCVYDIDTPCDYSRFPISKLNITFKSNVELSHRDFLGALMSLGIDRKAIGDILVLGDKCVIFCVDSVKDYIYANLKNVKKSKVHFSSEDFHISRVNKYEISNVNVASNRLDCIVAAAIKSSRGKATDLIKSGCVFLNSFQVCSLTSKVKDLDKISVRGFGKFIINDSFTFTGKGRRKISIKKYV